MAAAVRAGSILLAMALVGCTSGHTAQRLPDDPLLRRVAAAYGADASGAKFAVLYARDPDGRPLQGCGAHFCSDEHGIRITIFSSPLRSPEPHGVRTREVPPFTWFAARDGAVSRFGFIEYRPDARAVVWIQRVMHPPLNSMQAEFDFGSRYSVRYSYAAASDADHVRTYRAVVRYLQTVGLLPDDTL